MTSNAGQEGSQQRALLYKHLKSMKRGGRNHVLILQPDGLVIMNSLEREPLQHRATVKLQNCLSSSADVKQLATSYVV